VRPGELRCPADVSMMQTTDFADWHDLAPLRRLDQPPVRRIFGEGEVGSGVVVVREVARQDVAQVARSLRTRTWSRHPRRIEPMSRSAKGFCHGLRPP